MITASSYLAVSSHGFPVVQAATQTYMTVCDNQNLDGRATLLLLLQYMIVISHVFRLVSTTFYKQSNF